MPVQPTYNVGSQLDRAIAAYLTGVPIANVFPTNAVTNNLYPNIVIKAHSFTSEPVNVGREIWQVMIQIRQTSANNPNQANLEGATRVALDTLVGLVKANMLQTDDEQTLEYTCGLITAAGNALAAAADPNIAANNADMVNFTLENMYYKGGLRGPPEEEGCAWVEILNFECHAVPSVVT